MSANVHTILYASVMAIVSAALLAGVAEYTEPYRLANAEAEEMRSVLNVLGIPFEAKADPEALKATFDANVKRLKRKDGMETFSYIPAGRTDPQAVAVKFKGSGMWGPIKGYLAFAADGETLMGVVFYEQQETPGLGGDIGEDYFRARFVGRSIRGADGELGIRIKTGAPGPNGIDAITGATTTCKKVQAMLDTVIIQYIDGQEDADG